MADLDAQFEQAQTDVKTLTSKPSNDDLLTLYALFKQATTGEASTSKKPGRFDLVGKAKYEAWTKLAGTPADDAKTRTSPRWAGCSASGDLTRRRPRSHARGPEAGSSCAGGPPFQEGGSRALPGCAVLDARAERLPTFVAVGGVEPLGAHRPELLHPARPRAAR